MSLSAARILPSRLHARRAWLALAATLVAVLAAALLQPQTRGAGPIAVPGSHATAAETAIVRSGLALVPPAPSLDPSLRHGLPAESGSGESDDASLPAVFASWTLATSPWHAVGGPRAPAPRRPLHPRAQAPPALG